jgi:S-adenosylmethionine hydrolase
MTAPITLLTDFGPSGVAVSEMKGVILGLAPDARLVDISHTIAPQNIREGARILSRSPFYFPDGTVHIFVVDPGVGTARRPLAARLGAHTFVGPDNGALTLAIRRAQQEGWPMAFFHLDQPRYWRPKVSNIFHGRDIFAPVAAHLASGVPLERVGTPITDPVTLPLPVVERTATGLRGEVALVVQHFGNLITNIQASDLPDWSGVTVRVRGAEINGLVRTFGDRPPGELVALIGSDDELVIAEVNGHAGNRLGAQAGDVVEVVSGSG